MALSLTYRECPKCGAGYGAFQMTYRKALFFGKGKLKFRCCVCGFSWNEKTLDAEIKE